MKKFKIRWFHIYVLFVIWTIATIFYSRDTDPNLYRTMLPLIPMLAIATIICFFVHRKQIREEIEEEERIKRIAEENERRQKEIDAKFADRPFRYNPKPKPSGWNMALRVETVPVAPQPRSASSYSSSSNSSTRERLEELEEEAEELREQLEREEEEERLRLEEEDEERRRQEHEEAAEEERKREEEERERQEEAEYDAYYDELFDIK